MPVQWQINLLILAMLLLLAMSGIHSYLLFKGMADTEKFGRLLRKLRNYVKREATQ